MSLENLNLSLYKKKRKVVKRETKGKRETNEAVSNAHWLNWETATKASSVII